ncbi:hypothetical protein EDD11_004783 [Mortierella claussenii]|nr:hypothetical protein EDD11_004783 [Mortierella claussenii]
MTAIHATGGLYEATSNGHNGGHHAHEHAISLHTNSNKSKSRAQPVSFSQNVFSHLTLYSGNTIRTGTTGQLNTTLKKSNQELVSAVEDTLLFSLDAAQIDGSHITIADQASLGPLEGDRAKYDITGKYTFKLFFLSSAGVSAPLSVDELDRAIQNLGTVMGAASDLRIDHFILAIPNQTFDENGLDEAELKAFVVDVDQLYLPVWKRLSELQEQGRIGRLGVAEFSKQQLEILKDAAVKNGVVAPKVNQVNLQDCCVLPKDLIDYAKAEGIELLTHGDATNILPKSTLSSLLQPHLPATSESTLAPSTVLKYSALLSGRGLITRKGYIVEASAI